MLRDSRGALPRMQVLRAFEAAAQHSSFVRAAEELGIQQPIVSRYIAELEQQIGAQLFERNHRGVSLTIAGEIYRRGVTIGLDRIAAAALPASSILENQRVIVTCNHAVSHQFMMPRFNALRQALGENVSLRILTVDFEISECLNKSEVDLMITTDATISRSENRVTLFSEAFVPVCSPDFAATHANVLAQPVTEWGSLPFLRLLRPYNQATWHDWFEYAGYPSLHPRYIGFEDYVYLIQATIEGQGIALGWRYHIDHYLNTGTLVKLSGEFVERNDQYCFAKLTKRGCQRPVARRCLEILGTLVDKSVQPSLSETKIRR